MNMNIQELDIKQKEVFGSGIEHQVFTSDVNPNIIFKVGHKDVVNEWYNVFRSNPTIFPKVFRMGQLKDKNYYYVELEKLDTKKFEKKWDNLTLSLDEIGVINTDYSESFSDLYMNEGSDSEVFKQIAKELKSKKNKSFNFFIELLTLIKECERAILSTTGKDTLIDVHQYNFGYSSDGKLKCLDL